jgi:hypothetical protein
MRKVFVAVVALALLLVSFSTVFAAKPIQVKPWVYDPDKTGTAESKWVTGEGLPDAGKSNHALYLTKLAPTNTNAASGASVEFAGTLTELGFDYRNDGHCGAGAPRFNVYTETGGTIFFGCIHGIQTPAPDDPVNWTRVRFDLSVLGGAAVTGIDIVFDEGTNHGEGFVYLDNIDVNGVLVGKPGGAK